MPKRPDRYTSRFRVKVFLTFCVMVCAGLFAYILLLPFVVYQAVARTLPADAELHIGPVSTTGWHTTIQQTRISTPQYTLNIPETYLEHGYNKLFRKRHLNILELRNPQLTYNLAVSESDTESNWQDILANPPSIDQADIIGGTLTLRDHDETIRINMEGFVQSDQKTVTLALACDHQDEKVDIGATHQVEEREGEVKISGKLTNADFWQQTLNRLTQITPPEQLEVDFEELTFNSLVRYSLTSLAPSALIAEMKEPRIRYGELDTQFSQLALAVNFSGQEIERLSVGGPLNSFTLNGFSYLNAPQIMLTHDAQDGTKLEIAEGVIATPGAFMGKINLAATLPGKSTNLNSLNGKARIEELTNSKIGIKHLEIIATPVEEQLTATLNGEAYPVPLPIEGRSHYQSNEDWDLFLRIPRTRIENTHLFSSVLPEYLKDSNVSATVAARSSIQNREGNLTSRLRFYIRNSSLTLPELDTTLTGLELSYSGTAFPTLTSEAARTISFENLTFGDFSISRAQITYEIKENIIHVTHASGSFLGGQLKLAPFEVDLKNPVAHLRMDFDNIRLEDIPRLRESFDITVTGEVSGYLGVIFKDGEVIPQPGKLELRENTRARLSYPKRGWLSGAYAPGSNQRISMELVEQAMGDLWINQLRIDLFDPTHPDRPIYVRLEGEPASGRSRFPLILEQPIQATLSDLFNLGAFAPNIGGISFE